MTYADGFWFGLGMIGALFTAVSALCLSAGIWTALVRRKR